MATYSTVSICNKALVLCGASPITALTDDTANARALNAVYDISRQDFLTECRWTFAITRSTLVTNSTTDLIPWTYDDETTVYDRPTNVLRIWDVSELNAKWRVEGQYIIADYGSLGIIYTFDQEDLWLWTPKPMMAFIDKLCTDISYMITNNTTKAAAFFKKYNEVSLPNAEAESSQTGTQQTVRDSAWAGSKYGQNSGDPSRSYG